MNKSIAKQQPSGWQRHFVYRKESLRTTWKLRVSIVLAASLLLWATRGLWTVGIGKSLTCEERIEPSDALLVENFDPDYLVFERAAALQKTGVAARVLVPVLAVGDLEMPTTVSAGVAEVMAKMAHLPRIEVIPIGEREPISLNAANQIRDFLTREHVRSVVVVAPGFRSRRSLLVYQSALVPAGIQVRCSPVFGQTTPSNWTESWHGKQEVALQFAKLLYYRFYVLI